MPRTEGNATCVVAQCTHGMFWPTTEGHAASRGSWRQACGRQERFSRPHAFRGKTREREREGKKGVTPRAACCTTLLPRHVTKTHVTHRGRCFPTSPYAATLTPRKPPRANEAHTGAGFGPRDERAQTLAAHTRRRSELTFAERLLSRLRDARLSQMIVDVVTVRYDKCVARRVSV